MQIGIHELDITPPWPIPLAGFGRARTANHEGIHDPLHAGCAVFENNGEVVALVSCEVVGLNGQIIQRVREALLQKISDFPVARLVITCTHTHGAPIIKDPFVPFLIERLVTLIHEAWKDRQPRILLAGRNTHSEWTGFNRRHLETGFLPVDREVTFLGIREPSGETCAVLYHYACHPSTLGPHNLLVTADWPGFTRKMLQEKLGKQVAVLYLKGTEGDINTGYSAGVSSLGIPIPTRTYATAERVGMVVAKTLLSAWDQAKEISHSPIFFQSRSVPLEYQKTDGLEEAAQKMVWWDEEIRRLTETGRPEPHILAARVEHAYARFRLDILKEIAARGQSTLQVEQIAFRLGEIGFVNFPGEFFVESGLQVKQEAKTAFTFPLGITNDYQGYFPPATAFRQGGYEVACAEFVPETADRWTSSSIEMLNAL